jgi:cytochrome c peroxidase
MVLGPNGELPLFTDYSFDNLGVPKNLANPFYTMDTVLANGTPVNPLGSAWIDQGLGGFLETQVLYQALSAENMGRQKVPTLRNLDKRPNSTFVKDYTHNGYFKSIKEIVHFYNTRDVLPTCRAQVFLVWTAGRHLKLHQLS